MNERGRVSERAMKVLDVLERAEAYSPATAITDAEISKRTGILRRDIIDLAAELAQIDVAVLASCGSSRDGCTGKGRYIERDPAKVRAHTNGLHRRAAKIHGRAWGLDRCAERMEAKRKVETTGQGRLFA